MIFYEVRTVDGSFVAPTFVTAQLAFTTDENNAAWFINVREAQETVRELGDGTTIVEVQP